LDCSGRLGEPALPGVIGPVAFHRHKAGGDAGSFGRVAIRGMVVDGNGFAAA